ncbi:MAG TPA: tetratricopeptide repeat protein [Allosphingosinicella sp.]|jgi:cytochrome c-type biogenesis protein CcmH
MAQPDRSARRVSSATIALGAAGLLAAAAVGIAAFRSDDPAAEPVPSGNSAQAPNLDESIARLNESLRADPDNHERWFMLGLAYRDAENFQQAQQAFRRAMELSPNNPDYTAYVGEMMLLAGGDNPPPEAERLFHRVLELQPGNPQARYYLATLKDIRGDHRGAIDDLIALLREAPAGAVWESQVRDATVLIARRNNIDLGNRMPPQRQAPPSPATAAIPGPTREQMEAAKGLPPSQQDVMVQAMVERLANRLRQNPRDAEGWIRLMRSRMVLNDPNAARDALRSGLTAFEGDAPTQDRLRTAAGELGVPAG